MNLYLVNDDAARLCYADESIYALVWAYRCRQAVWIARQRCFDSEIKARDCYAERVDVAVVLPEGLPAPEKPGIENRAEVLRRVWFAEDGEEYCASCDLAAYGLEEYKVCNDCGNCRACGCDIDCGG